MTKTARVPDAANKHFQPVLQVTLGGITYPVYGSMTHTVSETRKADWEVIRQSYVAVTGDARPEVDQDRAKAVVAGELQIAWAKYHKRDDLLPSIELHHRKRIEDALASVQSDKPQPKKRSVERPHNPPTGDVKMSEDNNEVSNSNGDAAQGGGTATETRAKPERFSRGVMGVAAREIRAGNLDEADIVAKARAEHPECKSPERHIRYVAKELQTKLVKPAKEQAVPAPEASASEQTAEAGAQA